MNNKIINGYIKEVKKNLSCKKSESIFYTALLNDEINGFADEKENFTTEDLYKEFGTPESFAAKLLSNEDYHSLLKKTKKKALIWMVIAIAAIVLSAFCIYFISFMLDNMGGTVNVTDSFLTGEAFEQLK